MDHNEVIKTLRQTLDEVDSADARFRNQEIDAEEALAFGVLALTRAILLITLEEAEQ